MVLQTHSHRFFYACNIPFVSVEHPEFAKLMDLLRPGVRLLGRHTLGGRLLEEEYQRVVTMANKEMEGQRGTLSVDGWSSLTNVPVLGVSVRDWLLETIETTGKPHTGEYLREIMVRGVALAKKTLGVTTVAIVTDNASAQSLFSLFLF